MCEIPVTDPVAVAAADADADADTDAAMRLRLPIRIRLPMRMLLPMRLRLPIRIQLPMRMRLPMRLAAADAVADADAVVSHYGDVGAIVGDSFGTGAGAGSGAGFGVGGGGFVPSKLSAPSQVSCLPSISKTMTMRATPFVNASGSGPGPVWFVLSTFHSGALSETQTSLIIECGAITLGICGFVESITFVCPRNKRP